MQAGLYKTAMDSFAMFFVYLARSGIIVQRETSCVVIPHAAAALCACQDRAACTEYRLLLTELLRFIACRCNAA